MTESARTGGRLGISFRRPLRTASTPGISQVQPRKKGKRGKFTQNTFERREHVGHVFKLRFEWKIVSVEQSRTPHQLQAATQGLDCALHCTFDAQLFIRNLCLRKHCRCCVLDHQSWEDSLWRAVKHEQVRADSLQVVLQVRNRLAQKLCPNHAALSRPVLAGSEVARIKTVDWDNLQLAVG